MSWESNRQEEDEIRFESASYEYWTAKLNCEKKDLMEAIFKVGNKVTTVRSYLEMNGKIKEN